MKMKIMMIMILIKKKMCGEFNDDKDGENKDDEDKDDADEIPKIKIF